MVHGITPGVHCNLCVDPRTVETQVQSAAIMALGTTMLGHAISFKDGVVEQGNYHQFAQVRMSEVPKIAVHIVSSNDPPKGMGEPGLPPLAPALANAVRRATGKPVCELPFQLA